MSNNSVIFKGKKDGIIIILDGKINFNELKELFKEKILQAGSFFQGANLSITFKGRDLLETEEMELLDIISEVSGMNISFVHGEEEPVFVKQIKLSKIDDINLKNNKVKKLLNAYENITSFHKGSVRSGQSLKFKGSIIIIGDVNPGGEVIAEGNVIVIGSLKGLVHAGCTGCADCFVIGVNMSPTQLRIADIVTYFPKKDNKARGKIFPECAFAKNGEIYVEPLINF